MIGIYEKAEEDKIAKVHTPWKRDVERVLAGNPAVSLATVSAGRLIRRQVDSL